jgi:hypothetical protein
MRKNVLNIVLVALLIVVISVVVYLVLRLRKSSNWPLGVKITNKDKTDITLNMYLNGTEIDGSPVIIKAGETKTIYLEAKNPRTFKPYTQKQTKHIVVYMPSNGNLYFESINLPKHNTVLADNISGLAPKKTNLSGNWSDQGYYVVIFE